MRPTKSLILALREVAENLRQPDAQYNWAISHTCNCGLLARALCGDEIVSKITYGVIGYWSDNVDLSFCSTTGLPTKELFKILYQHGLEKLDFHRLEWRCGMEPKTVADSFDQLADDLEKQRSTL